MCVLAVLSKGDSYGYDLAEELSSKIQIADGTVYPLLRKLASTGEVSTYLKESSGGPPRKYYSLTDKGRQRLETDTKEWKEFTALVSGIIGGEQ